MSPKSTINKLFAEAIFAKYQTQRFGLKNCNNKVDVDLAYDLLNLYNVADSLVDCNPEEQLACCPLCVIEERINTL